MFEGKTKKYMDLIKKGKKICIRSDEAKVCFEDELIASLIDFKKKDFSLDLQPEADTLLKMLKSYSELVGFYIGIPASEVMPLFNYFLRLEDADSCLKLLQCWHKIEFHKYSYAELADRYSAMVGDFSMPDKAFRTDERGLQEWETDVHRMPRIGVPREYAVYKIVKLLGKLDARQSASDDEVYYSQKTKDAILYASIGGYSRITKVDWDRHCHVIMPKQVIGQPLDWAERYRYCLMQVHDKAYAQEKDYLKSLEERIFE